MNRKFRKQKSLNIRSLKRGLPSRWVALEIIDQVLLYGKTVREIKDSSDFPLNELKHSERARALSLSDTILRNLSSFDSLINQFLKKGEINLRVRNILRLVTAELVCDNLASHAVVDSAVSLTRKDVKTRHLAGLTNAISRRISGKSQTGLTLEKPKLSFDFAKQLKEIYGEDVVKVYYRSIKAKNQLVRSRPERIYEAEILPEQKYILDNELEWSDYRNIMFFDIETWYDADHPDAVSYTHLTLPTKA